MLCAEVTKALRARKHEKMQRCEAIRQQHELLRRGDLAGEGAEQSGRDQVIYNQRCLFRSLTKKNLLACNNQPLTCCLCCRFRRGSGRTATGAPARRPGEAATGSRRCRASPRPRARAASLNPPPAELMLLTGLCHLGHFFLSSFSLRFLFVVGIKCLSLARKLVNQSVRAGSIGRLFRLFMLVFDMMKLKLGVPWSQWFANCKLCSDCLVAILTLTVDHTINLRVTSIISDINLIEKQSKTISNHR
jgi:hypothetical protein